MPDQLPVPDQWLGLHTKNAGDTVEWSKISASRPGFPCGHCSQQLHHARGKGPMPSRAHTTRTHYPTGQTLNLCRAHATEWEQRDAKTSKAR